MPSHSDDDSNEVPFFPNVLLAEVSFAVAVIGLLAIFVSLFPLKLAEKFDPLNPPAILEPEWYFMGMYQFLKTENIQPFHGILLAVGLGLFLVAVPFIDRGPERSPLRRPIFTALALLIVGEFLALTIYGYMTPGRVALFSDPAFVGVLVTTNLVIAAIIVLVYVAHKRAVRGAVR